VRLASFLGFDGNPLRRASDRAEAWIRAGLLIILLTAGPMAALAAGQWTAHAGATDTGAQQHAVRAVLLRPATAPARPGEAFGGARVRVMARWEGAGGSARTREVPAPADAADGTAGTVWLNASGRVTGPPQRDDFAFAAVMTAVMTLAVIALALLVALRLSQRFLDWRRLTAWDAALRRWQEHEAF
jgi:hypothetical protein